MTTLKTIWASLQCCLNWKVLAGAGGVAGAVLLFQPSAAGRVVPLAIVLVCPLSMGIMMWRMRGGADHGQITSAGDAEIRALSEEIARLRTTAVASSRSEAPAVPMTTQYHGPAETQATAASAAN